MLLTALAAAALCGPAGAQKGPAVVDLLRLGADYVADYPARVSGVILEEAYLLVEIGSRMTVPKRISSDVVLVNLHDQVLALRDVFAVDTKPTRERQPRINLLLAEPTLARWAEAQQVAHGSAHEFRAEIVAAANAPTLALQLLDAGTQPKLTWRLDGQRTMNGVRVSGLRFQEPIARNKTYILGTRGNAAASGRFWLNPADGTIHQTELWLESPTEVARVQVRYAAHPALQMWLPAETTETYEQRVVGVGQYNARQAFECSATYTNVRHMPIDLSKIRK
jgi:hypothetical protein